MTGHESGRESNDQNLGPQYVFKCAEGDVGGGRTQARASTYRYWRLLRQEQGSALSCDESEWPRTDARGGGWIFIVGVEFRRSLSCREARQERCARAKGFKATRTSKPMDGLAIIRGRSRNISGVLGTHPHAAGKARHGSNQDFPGQNHRRDENPRRAIGQNPIRCWTVVFLR